MERVKVIPYANLPARLPLVWTLVTWLMMDRLHATAFWWGFMGSFLVFIWAVAIIAIFTQSPKEPQWQV